MNAIIHAARSEMIDSTLYLVGLDAEDQTIVEGAKPCKICARLIINAGIKKVKVLEKNDFITTFDVDDFIINEEMDFTKANGY